MSSFARALHEINSKLEISEYDECLKRVSQRYSITEERIFYMILKSIHEYIPFRDVRINCSKYLPKTTGYFLQVNTDEGVLNLAKFPMTFAQRIDPDPKGRQIMSDIFLLKLDRRIIAPFMLYDERDNYFNGKKINIKNIKSYDETVTDYDKLSNKKFGATIKFKGENNYFFSKKKNFTLTSDQEEIIEGLKKNRKTANDIVTKLFKNKKVEERESSLKFALDEWLYKQYKEDGDDEDNIIEDNVSDIREIIYNITS